MANVELANLTLAVDSAGQTVAVDPATIVTGDTEGYIRILSKTRGRVIFQTQKSKDSFAIIAPTDELFVENLGSSVSKIVLFGKEA